MKRKERTMYRLLFSTGLAVLAVVAGASGANGAGPDFEKVSGAGYSQSQGLVQVSADDRDGPSGHFFIGDAQAEGDVTCLTVNPGGGARIGGVDRTTGTAYLILVIDDVEQPGIDTHQWRQAQPFEVANPGCSLFGITFNPVAIESGNYTISQPPA
jgi:hypothetical protein